MCSSTKCKTEERVSLLWKLDVNKALKSLQFSRSIVSDSLRPHEPQHAKPPYPSPTPGVHPNPWPLCRWCHPAISSSVVPYTKCHNYCSCTSHLFSHHGEVIRDYRGLGWLDSLKPLHFSLPTMQGSPFLCLSLVPVSTVQLSRE